MPRFPTSQCGGGSHLPITGRGKRVRGPPAGLVKHFSHHRPTLFSFRFRKWWAMGNAGEVGGNLRGCQFPIVGDVGVSSGRCKQPGSQQMGESVAGTCSSQGWGQADNPLWDCIPYTPALRCTLPRVRVYMSGRLSVCVCVAFRRLDSAL